MPQFPSNTLILTELWLFYLDSEDKFIGCFIFEEGEHFERCIEICCYSIVHDNELSFWRCDFECFIS